MSLWPAWLRGGEKPSLCAGDIGQGAEKLPQAVALELSFFTLDIDAFRADGDDIAPQSPERRPRYAAVGCGQTSEKKKENSEANCRFAHDAKRSVE